MRYDLKPLHCRPWLLQGLSPAAAGAFALTAIDPPERFRMVATQLLEPAASGGRRGSGSCGDPP